MNPESKPATMTASRTNDRSLCIVLHDVAPATLAPCRRVIDALENFGRVPLTLLAVPRYHGQPRDAAFERWLASRAFEHGDEVALHGFTHLDERAPRNWLDHLRRRHYTRGEGEFSDLPLDDARARIDAGLQWLHELGIEPAGFVAPAWLLGDSAWRALREQSPQRFDYTCTLRHIHLLPQSGLRLTAQAQVWSHSAAWRRGMSVLWNGTLASLQRAQPVVRLELHPADADHALLARSWQRLVRDQLHTRAPRTLRQVAADFRTASGSSAR